MKEQDAGAGNRDSNVLMCLLFRLSGGILKLFIVFLDGSRASARGTEHIVDETCKDGDNRRQARAVGRHQIRKRKT